jgi:trehalose/maltose hydrolase-like predicted phosphorylase
LEPPKLFIYSPLDGYISKQTSTMVEGETEQGAKLVINGQDVDVNNQGRFSVKLDLVSGLNTLNISTAKKHGKTTKKTVYVIVKPDTFTLDNQNDLKNN